MLRPRFFALHRPLRKRAFDGAAQHEKSAQQGCAGVRAFRVSVGIRTQDPRLRRLSHLRRQRPDEDLVLRRLHSGGDVKDVVIIRKGDSRAGLAFP